MLRELDRLGQVGTRVIKGSRENLVATLRHLEPSLRELADAGDSLPRGLGLMASFPFPKEAADLAKGDYANALFYMKFDLNKLFGSGGVQDSPNIPSPVEICMVTPAKPLCQKLSDSLLQQLCALMPTNPLCPGVGPAPERRRSDAPDPRAHRSARRPAEPGARHRHAERHRIDDRHAVERAARAARRTPRRWPVRGAP